MTPPPARNRVNRGRPQPPPLARYPGSHLAGTSVNYASYFLHAPEIKSLLKHLLRAAGEYFDVGQWSKICIKIKEKVIERVRRLKKVRERDRRLKKVRERETT